MPYSSNQNDILSAVLSSIATTSAKQPAPPSLSKSVKKSNNVAATKDGNLTDNDMTENTIWVPVFGRKRKSEKGEHLMEKTLKHSDELSTAIVSKKQQKTLEKPTAPVTSKTYQSKYAITEISSSTKTPFPSKKTGNATVVSIKSSQKSSQPITGLCKPAIPEQLMNPLLSLPYETLTNDIMSFLRPEDLLSLGSTSKAAKKLTEDGFLWQTLFKERFPGSKLNPNSMQEWKLAYRLSLSKLVERLRCFATQFTFLEDVLGVGLDYTVNPKTNQVDYISVSQDLISETAFVHKHVRSDVFGNKFQLFLPLYFSEEHFQRALPTIRKTLMRLCRGQNGCFQPSVILDVFPKIITTFVVLLADEGVSASRKSFIGLLRMHRLFLALAHHYPGVQEEAKKRIEHFMASEQNRLKSSCPNLGAVLPLLMILDQDEMDWRTIRPSYLGESFDRSVLWVCKDHPKLAVTRQPNGAPENSGQGEERLKLTRSSMTVSLRLIMFHVCFLKTCCQGSTQERANKYDLYLGQPEPQDKNAFRETTSFQDESDQNVVDEESVGDAAANETNLAIQDSKAAQSRTQPPSLSFETFRNNVNVIFTSTGWQSFFRLIGLKGPKSKWHMAEQLRIHVNNSLRKKYHRTNMDFSRIQASGTSRILHKGQQYSMNNDLSHVIFQDSWCYEGSAIRYLDATCLVYGKNNKRISVVDYSRQVGLDGAILHSGDVMHEGGGQHTINIHLDRVPANITTLVFVLSAYIAKFSDIISPMVSFTNANDEDGSSPLCVYELDKQDKIDHLTSVIMCKLYRTQIGGAWHVQAIGDAHRGDASNYKPIYNAVAELLG